MDKFIIIETGEEITGRISGTDEMFDGDDFYQIIETADGTYKAYYLPEDQQEALDEYGNLILDQIDYAKVSYIRPIK